MLPKSSYNSYDEYLKDGNPPIPSYEKYRTKNVSATGTKHIVADIFCSHDQAHEIAVEVNRLLAKYNTKPRWREV